VDQWVQLSCRGLRPCEGPPEAHVPAIEIGGGESNGRENKGTNKGKQRANKGSNNLKGAHKWAHRDKCLVRGIKVTCEAATPWVEKQQTTEPHALQSSEQVCLRVWGWMRCGVGQGGAGGPIKPLSGAFSNPLESHFVCNCPARAPGLNVRLV
jgi:hypothetical protein